MPIATGLALGLGALAAGGSIGGAAIESNAAGNAAKTQSNAANYAANLQAEEAQQALGLQAGEYNQTQQTAAPFIQGGESAYANLENLLGITPSSFSTTPVFQPTPLNPGTINFPGTNTPISPIATGDMVHPAYGSNIAPVSTINPALQVHAPGATTSTAPSQTQTLASLINPSLGATGSLSQGWNQTFQSPTIEQARNDPGYQFQLEQGQQAIQNSAAARGGLLSGNTAQALDQFSQGLADTSYNDVYNRALQTYNTNYNTFENNQTNQYNRLAALAGLGQQTASQLNSTGLATASNAANTLTNTGAQIGQDMQNAGAATASGYVGRGNALAGGLSGATGSLSQLAMLYNLLNGGGGSAGLLGPNGETMNQTAGTFLA